MLPTTRLEKVDKLELLDKIDFKVNFNLKLKVGSGWKNNTEN